MLPASAVISMVEWDSKKGCHQCLSSWEESKLPSASSAAALKLVSGSPFPMSYVLFDLMFLHWFLLSWGNLHVTYLWVGFAFLTIQWFSGMYSQLVSKPSVLGVCVRYKGWRDLCGTQISHSLEKSSMSLRSLPTIEPCIWGMVGFLRETVSLPLLPISVLSLVERALSNF